MRRNGHNTTSGIKSDHAIRSGMPENLYVREILAKNAILWVFFLNVKFLPYSLHWRFSAHARKTGSCCPILMPNELVLTILVPNHHAKFGDDRLRIADARVVTDGHDRQDTEASAGSGHCRLPGGRKRRIQARPAVCCVIFSGRVRSYEDAFFNAFQQASISRALLEIFEKSPKTFA